MVAPSMLLFVPLLVSPALALRSLHVKNQCSETLWPALFTSSGDSNGAPLGWEMAEGATMTLSLGDDWSGRVWGRTGCDFNADVPEYEMCDTGGCNGGFLCDTAAGTGVPPVTLAEITFASTGEDWYDVSLVDGFNLPMTFAPSNDGTVAACRVDLNGDCPDELQVTGDSGDVVGCKTTCQVDKNPANSPNCCSGDFNLPSTCPPSGIEYYDYFKQCKNSYVYAYDESSGTALFKTSNGGDFTVTFCP